MLVMPWEIVALIDFIISKCFINWQYYHFDNAFGNCRLGLFDRAFKHCRFDRFHGASEIDNMFICVIPLHKRCRSTVEEGCIFELQAFPDFAAFPAQIATRT